MCYTGTCPHELYGECRKHSHDICPMDDMEDYDEVDEIWKRERAKMIEHYFMPTGHYDEAVHPAITLGGKL